MTKRDFLCEYLYNKMCRMEAEYNQIRLNVWYRKPDELDLLEQIIAKVKYENTNEIMREIYQILMMDV